MIEWTSLLSLVLLAAELPCVVRSQQNGGESAATLLASQVEVQSPDRLQGLLNHRGALFGKNPFGETLTRNVYYTKRPLCNGQVPDTPDYIKAEGYLLLVDRGDCSFVEKIRNAQRDNATAVLIADNTCLCSIEGSCDEGEECEKVEPTMDDDGTGVDIHIPSLLLFKPDADRLRSELVSGTMIEMSLSFPVPKAVNGRTEYTLWSTPDDLMSHQFLSTFYDAAIGFGDKAHFNPKMLVTDGQEKGCRQHEEDHIPCDGYCTNYGRYCEPRSYYDSDVYDDKGTKMVVESLRRACIWDIYGRSDGIGREWWSYVEAWMLECSHSRYSSTCSESLYQVAGIDKEELESCIISTGNFREDTTNDLLEASLIDAALYDIHWAPRLIVNGALIEGSLTFGTAVEAICASLEDGGKPEICDKWNDCAESCGDDVACVLWGNENECGEYHAPFLTNDDKQYDDDYIDVAPGDNTEVEAQETGAPTAAFVLPTTDAPTDAPVSPAPTSSPTAEPSRRPTPVMAPVTSPIFLPTTPEFNNRDEFPTANAQDNAHSGGENQEVTETIQIYEGSSSSGFAIGIGVGVGCMVLVAILVLLVCRDRQSRRRLEELTTANMSGTYPRGDWSSASRSHFSGHRPPPSVGHYTEDNFYDEEEEYYYDEASYPPAPRRGRPRVMPRRMMGAPRSFASRFARGVSTVDEEDEEIEALVAQHYRERDSQQKHKRSSEKRSVEPVQSDEEEEEPDVEIKLPLSRKPAQKQAPTEKKIHKEKIREVIHLEDAVSVTKRSKRTGSW
ncbi:MAG: hypothetical protein SGILL_001704 [Bacillariaceae sp.]